MNIKKYLVLILLFLFGVFLLLQIDDPLDTEVLEWVKSVDYKTPNDSYYYLLGLNVSADQDPLEFGKAKVKEMREWEAEIIENGYAENSNAYSFSLRPDRNLLNSRIECELNSLEDYINMFEDNDFQRSLSNEQKIYLSRYRHWLKLSPLKPMSYPFYGTSFSYVFDVNDGYKLYLRNLVYQFTHGNKQLAAQEMQKGVLHLIELIKNSGPLVERLALLKLLNQHLNVLAIMIQRHPEMFSKIVLEHKHLTDITATLNYELVFSYNTIKVLQNEGRFPPFWMNWFGIAFAKPNMTTNRLLTNYLALKDISVLTSRQFFEQDQSSCKQVGRWSLIDKIRNFHTYLTSDRNICKFRATYLTRGYDLFAKISLINSLVEEEGNVPIKTAINPFTGSKDAFYKNDKKQLCFKSSASDQKYQQEYSCIYITPI